MSYKLGKNKSIKQRLNQVSLTTVMVFFVIAVGLIISAHRVWIDIDRIVEERFQKTIANSQNSRDFGLLLSRLGVFQTEFFGDDSYLRAEGRSLQENFGRLKQELNDPRFGQQLEDLIQHFKVYLDRAEWINVLLQWRSDQDLDLDDLLLVLQELLAERTIEVALTGGNVDYLEQLVMLVSGYRESFLEIAKLNAEEDRKLLFASQVKDAPPLKKELEGLALRLRTLTASEPPFDRFGRHLISRIEYYQYLMRLYQLEMIQLNQQNVNLKNITGKILAAMAELDHQAAFAAIRIKTEIKRTIYTTVSTILVILAILALISWMTHRALFRKHIQRPMDSVSQRLNEFQRGDYSTPMKLERGDEWGRIETTFNDMLSTLNSSNDALRESEKRYREIFTNATEGIFRSTLEGQFLELNPAAVDILGFDSVTEAKNYYQNLGGQLYHHPGSREEMLKKLYAQGTSLNFETLMRRRDGELFWCSVNNYLIRDEQGQIQYLEGTIRDISEKKVAQDSLQQLKSYLQNIIDSMPSILIGVDIDMNVTLWNKRAEEESQSTVDQTLGLPLKEACRLFTSDAYYNQLRETLNSRKPERMRKVESQKRSEDSGKRFFDILIYPLALGTDRGAVIYMEEVTDRAHLEEMMIRSEKMQSVGSLAAGLAHEINNPLAAVLQNAQVLGQRLSPDLKKNADVAEELGTTIETIDRYAELRGCSKMLQSILDAGQRAAKIVSNMQSFSRYGAVNFTGCSLAELFDRTLDLASSDYDMRHHFDFQNIKIVRDFHSVPKIFCESSQIQQVLLSLLKNAAQAMSESPEESQLTIRIYPLGEDHVTLQLEDNGPGMDEGVCARIFDPFYTTQDVGLGSGLGLSIAYFIVTQNHNGRLSVISQPGHGTRFEMVLPLKQEEESYTF